jgi:hypothetical protein
MEIAIGIISVFLTAIFFILPYLINKYYSRPELTIEIIPNGGVSLQIGLSENNDFSKEYIDADTAIRIFELTWKFNVVITNNSDLTAFYPKIEFNPKGSKFTLIDELKELRPIKPNESLTLEAEYNKLEETTGRDRTQIGQAPPIEFGNLELLLGYENSKKMRFFTLYNYCLTDNKNKFLRNKPKDYNKN